MSSKKNEEPGSAASDLEQPAGKQTSAKAKPRHLRKSASLDQRIWVKAIRVATHFDISEGAVLRGECGMEQLRWAYVPGTEHKARPTRRFRWDDVLMLDARMKKESEPKPSLIPGNILALMPRQMRRRR